MAKKNSSAGKKKGCATKFVLCPYTNQKVFIIKATVQDLKGKSIYNNGSKKRLFTLTSSQLRHEHYAEAAQALASLEQSMLPSFGGRSWEVTCKLSEPNGQVLFRAWKGKMELAVLPHLMEKIPDPPVWPGKRRQPDEYLEHEDGSDLKNLQNREVSTLSSVAWEFRNRYAVPNVTLKWKSPDHKIFNSRRAAWEHAEDMAAREVQINKYILGIGASGKLLQPSIPSATTALQTGKLRFERDGLWIVGQELRWQEDRPQELLEEQEETEKEERPRIMSGLALFLQSKREDYRNSNDNCATLRHAETELRKVWKALSKKERKGWNKQARGEQEGEEESEEESEEEENVQLSRPAPKPEPKPQPKASKPQMTPLMFYIKTRRKRYREDRRMESPRITFAAIDTELRETWKTLSAIEKAGWKEKLEESLRESEEDHLEAPPTLSRDIPFLEEKKEDDCTAGAINEAEAMNEAEDVTNNFTDKSETSPETIMDNCRGLEVHVTNRPESPGKQRLEDKKEEDPIKVGTNGREMVLCGLMNESETTTEVELEESEGKRQQVMDHMAELSTEETIDKTSDDEKSDKIYVTTKPELRLELKNTESSLGKPTISGEPTQLISDPAPEVAKVIKSERELTTEPGSADTCPSKDNDTVTTAVTKAVEFKPNAVCSTSNFLVDSISSQMKAPRKSSKKKRLPTAKANQRWCLKKDQIDLCYDACLEHFDSVMRTVKARDLSRELQDGFDVLRERGRGRFDMELPAFESPTFEFLTSLQKAPWMPVVRSILGDDIVLIHKGCFLSMPGAEAQEYHQDGVHLTRQTQRPCHAINVFVPLVDLHNRNGPTEFCLGSHILGHEGYDRDFVEVPKPKAGTPVIFDYRLGHRGLGNSSQSCRPIVYCTYARSSDGKEFRDSVNFSRKRYHKIGELVEKPLSREERRKNRKRSIQSREETQSKKAMDESKEAESIAKKTKLHEVRCIQSREETQLKKTMDELKEAESIVQKAKSHEHGSIQSREETNLKKTMDELKEAKTIAKKFKLHEDAIAMAIERHTSSSVEL